MPRRPRQSVQLGSNLCGTTKAQTYVRNGMRMVEITTSEGWHNAEVVVSRRENIYKLRDWLNENFPVE